MLAAPLVPEFALLDGHAVIEIKPAAHTKDSAVTAFMQRGAVRGPHADLHRRRPDRLRRIRGGAPLRRTGDRGRTAGEVGVVAAGPGRGARLARATGGRGWRRVNYGVIGNCQVAALIDEQARMVWACLPRPDGDPVFSALLQKEGGASETGRVRGRHARPHAHRTVLSTQLRHPRDAPVRLARRRHAHRRFRAALPQPRPRVPADDVRAQRGAARGPADAAPAAAAHRGFRRALRARASPAAITSASRPTDCTSA